MTGVPQFKGGKPQFPTSNSLLPSPKISTMELDKIRIPFRLGEIVAIGSVPGMLLLSLGLYALTRNEEYFTFLLAVPALAFVFGFWLGRLPGNFEAASTESIFLNPRSEHFSWLYELSRDQRFNLPDTKYFNIADSGFHWDGTTLIVFNQAEQITIGSGPEVKLVLAWLIRHGLQPK